MKTGDRSVATEAEVKFMRKSLSLAGLVVVLAGLTFWLRGRQECRPDRAPTSTPSDRGPGRIHDIDSARIGSGDSEGAQKRQSKVREAFELCDRERIKARTSGELESHSSSVLDEIKSYREKRLLVLGFPDEAAGYYAPRALGEGGVSREEREEAILAVSILAETKRDDIRKVLLDLARRDEGELTSQAYLALRHFHDPDTASFLIQRAQSGQEKALWVLPLFANYGIVDAAASQILAQSMIDRAYLDVFRDRLKDIQVLIEGDRARIALLDLERPKLVGQRTLAADFIDHVALAERRDLLPALRARADGIFKSVADMTPRDLILATQDRTAPAPISLRINGCTNGELQNYFVDGTVRIGLTYDETLIAIARLGGDLTEWERARLAYFGFGTDVRSRAQAILDRMAD